VGFWQRVFGLLMATERRKEVDRLEQRLLAAALASPELREQATMYFSGRDIKKVKRNGGK